MGIALRGTRDTGRRCGCEFGDGGGGAVANWPLASSTLPVAVHADYGDDAAAACITRSTAKACHTPSQGSLGASRLSDLAKG